MSIEDILLDETGVRKSGKGRRDSRRRIPNTQAMRKEQVQPEVVMVDKATITNTNQKEGCYEGAQDISVNHPNLLEVIIEPVEVKNHGIIVARVLVDKTRQVSFRIINITLERVRLQKQRCRICDRHNTSPEIFHSTTDINMFGSFRPRTESR